MLFWVRVHLSGTPPKPEGYICLCDWKIDEENKIIDEGILAVWGVVFLPDKAMDQQLITFS